MSEYFWFYPNYYSIDKYDLLDHCIACIARGSAIYGTANKKSDIDMLCIMPDTEDLSICGYIGQDGAVEISLTGPKGISFDIHVIHESDFIKGIKDNDIAFLELLWQPKTKYDFQYENFHNKYNSIFELDPWKLRCAVSSKCNNSWAKCQKKLTVELDALSNLSCDNSRANDLCYIGRKSMWHVFRIYDFAIQILQNGKIINYCPPEIKKMYKDIVKSNYTWPELKALYQAKRNEYASNLRKLAERPN